MILIAISSFSNKKGKTKTKKTQLSQNPDLLFITFLWNQILAIQFRTVGIYMYIMRMFHLSLSSSLWCSRLICLFIFRLFPNNKFIFPGSRFLYRSSYFFSRTQFNSFILYSSAVSFTHYVGPLSSVILPQTFKVSAESPPLRVTSTRETIDVRRELSLQ